MLGTVAKAWSAVLTGMYLVYMGEVRYAGRGFRLSLLLWWRIAFSGCVDFTEVMNVPILYFRLPDTLLPAIGVLRKERSGSSLAIETDNKCFRQSRQSVLTLRMREARQYLCTD